MKVHQEIKVLVVEDNSGDFFMVQEYLDNTAGQFMIKRSSTVRETLTILSSNVFDVILLDLSLPDSSGLHSVKAILEAANGIPLIVFTGFNDKQYGIDSLKMGAQDYLVKDEINGSFLIKSILYSIERSEVKKEIIKQERLFRIITENSIDAKFLLDEKGNVVFCTSSVLSITGYGCEECLGKNERDFIHPDDVDLFFTCIDVVKQDPKQYPVMEVRIRHKEGGFVWCRKTIVNLLHEEHVNAIVCTFWDISGEKESKEIVEASEERYRYLFNNNPAVILIWNPENFVIEQINCAAVQQYGYSRTEFLAKSILDLRPAEDIPLIKSFAAEALKDDTFMRTAIWRHLHKDGYEMFMQISSHRIIYNKKPSLLSIAINITEKLALEKTLEMEKMEKARQITQAVITAQENEREQIGRELHDNVAQLLASSRLYIRLIRTDDTDSNSYINEAEAIVNQAINEIRKLSHALIPPTFCENELMHAIDNVIKIITIGGHIQIDKQLIGFDETTIPDELRLTIYRIIQEQFNNIIKYADANIIYLKLTQQNGNLSLSIKDDGKGFDPAQKTTGVGLINIKTRASMFNGKVTINSAPGCGCELIVCFNCC